MKTTEEYERKIYKHTNLRVIFSITLIAIMGVDAISPAFPKMIQELDISSQEVGLLISAFTLPMIFTTLIWGVLSDRLGRKKVLFPLLILFAIAGGSCAFVRDFNLLLVLRFFQGIGGCGCMPIGNAIIGDLYSGSERATAIGYNSSFVSVAHGTFPSIGGALAMIAWNFPFLLFFLAIPVSLLVLFLLKNPEPKYDTNLREYLRNTFQSVKNRRALALFVATVFTFIVFYGSYLSFFSILVGISFGATSFVIGLLLSSMSIVAAIVSSQVGRLTKRFSEMNLLIVAFALYAIGMLIIPSVTNIWLLLVPVVIFGIGHGMNIPIILTLVLSLAHTEHRAAFLAVDEMVVRLGQTLGPLIMGLVLVAAGISSVFYVGAILSATMFVFVIVALRRSKPS